MNKIAFCGTRGVPANYGGFETAVDEITRRLVEKGHACEVFCRAYAGDEVAPTSHEGRSLVYVRGSRNRKLDTFVASLAAAWHLFRHRKTYKHVFWFNNANFLGIMVTKALGLPVSVNTDGLEWRRKKWSWPFQAYYYVTSWLLARSGVRLISDSQAIQRYYADHFGVQTLMVPYGHPEPRPPGARDPLDIVGDFGLVPGRYFLQITRIEPDNLPLEAAKAFLSSGLGDAGFKFMIIGLKEDTPYARELKGLSGQKGLLVEKALYDGEVLQALRTYAYCYVHGNSVGGTNPALLEAMMHCPRVLAIESPFSAEVLGELGITFRQTSFAEDFLAALGGPDQREALRKRVTGYYQWEQVARCYAEIAEDGYTTYSPVLEKTIGPLAADPLEVRPSNG